MGKKRTGSNTFFKISVIMVLFLAMAGLVAFKTTIFRTGSPHSEGLSGLVSVKGTVSLKQLDLSRNEVKKINRAVSAHKETFSQVNLFLDMKGDSSKIDKTTTLVWAMTLQTNGDCEIRSWSRKIPRNDLVAQMVLYMNKAAREYKEFKRFPDVKQNFKCLYI